MPTKIGLNGFLITIKRTNAIKAFENLENVDDTDSQKKNSKRNGHTRMKFTAIRENHLFGKAYRGGKKAGGKSCSVYVLKDRQARRYMLARPDKRYINRIGISASKKIGGAVARNRAKRRRSQ